jgi:DNA-directed RNA polymerase subunit M
LDFCPKCGKMLNHTRQGGAVLLVCKRCGYSKPLEEEQTIVTSSKSSRRAAKDVLVIDHSDDSPLPTTHDVECPQCGNNEAKWWTVQTRSADEPMTQFFRCTRCGHTWREYA